METIHRRITVAEWENLSSFDKLSIFFQILIRLHRRSRIAKAFSILCRKFKNMSMTEWR